MDDLFFWQSLRELLLNPAPKHKERHCIVSIFAVFLIGNSNWKSVFELSGEFNLDMGLLSLQKIAEHAPVASDSCILGQIYLKWTPNGWYFWNMVRLTNDSKIEQTCDWHVSYAVEH